MRKGESTKERIIAEAAGVFNEKGFAGASLSDIMQATGLKKGGIYRHFANKEELASEAFGYAVAQMGARFALAVDRERTAVGRLRAIIGVYSRVPLDPPVSGGCPMLSAAADSDYGDSPLREQVRVAMDGLRGLVRRIVVAGVERNELRRGLDGEHVATVFTATMEGAILLAQLYDDSRYVRQAAEHLEEYLERSLSA